MSRDGNIQRGTFLKNHNYHHKNSIDDSNHHDEMALYQGINKRDTNGPRHQNSAYHKNSPIDCDGAQLTNAQCHVTPIYIL